MSSTKRRHLEQTDKSLPQTDETPAAPEVQPAVVPDKTPDTRSALEKVEAFKSEYAELMQEFSSGEKGVFCATACQYIQDSATSAAFFSVCKLVSDLHDKRNKLSAGSERYDWKQVEDLFGLINHKIKSFASTTTGTSIEKVDGFVLPEVDWKNPATYNPQSRLARYDEWIKQMIHFKNPHYAVMDPTYHINNYRLANSAQRFWKVANEFNGTNTEFYALKDILSFIRSELFSIYNNAITARNNS